MVLEDESLKNRNAATVRIYLGKSTKAYMPQEWTVGFDIDSIVDHELYSIPAMPVMYLLDSDKKVLLKDAFLPDIENRLKAIH